MFKVLAKYNSYTSVAYIGFLKLMDKSSLLVAEGKLQTSAFVNVCSVNHVRLGYE